MPVRSLFVTSFPPFPQELSGGAIRSRLLLDALARCGPVSILYLNYRGRSHELDGANLSLPGGTPCLVHSVPMFKNHRFNALADKAIRAAGMAFGAGMASTGLRVSSQARAAVDSLIKRDQIDLLVGRLTRPSAVAGLLEQRATPLIVDADDWEPSRIASRMSSTPAYRLASRAIQHRLLHAARHLAALTKEHADHIWVASEHDASRIAQPNVTTLPNIPLAEMDKDIEPLKRSDPSSQTLFAVGEWARPQNSDGMKWFLNSVWPTILERTPQAELRIAGVMPEDIANNWGARPGVRILGFVDDLAGEYERAAAVVAPITWGGGTKIKVLEALAYGRAPAGPAHAFQGLANQAALGDIAAITDEPDELAARIVDLLCDPATRHTREASAADYYRRGYSREIFDRHVSDTIQKVMSSAN